MELNLDTFGEIMDKFIHENEICLLVSKQAMTDDWWVNDNTGAGSVMQFYILLNALGVVLADIIRTAGLDGDIEGMIDGLLRLVKEDVLNGIHPEGGEADAAE